MGEGVWVQGWLFAIVRVVVQTSVSQVKDLFRGSRGGGMATGDWSGNNVDVGDLLVCRLLHQPTRVERQQSTPLTLASPSPPPGCLSSKVVLSAVTL